MAEPRDRKRLLPLSRSAGLCNYARGAAFRFYLAVAKFVHNPAYRIGGSPEAKYVAFIGWPVGTDQKNFNSLLLKRGQHARFGKFVALREQHYAVGNGYQPPMAPHFADISCI